MENYRAIYKRILLKLSGEALLGKSDKTGIDNELLNQIANEILEIHGLGVQIAIVIGGGNIIRGSEIEKTGVDRVTGDHMGMLATVINALAIQNCLEAKGLATRVMSAIEINKIVEPYIKRRAVRHLEKGRVVIFAAGTGNPFFTTDTAASLRANEIKADALFKATKVNGVYDSDPVKNSDAKFYDMISYSEVLKKDLKVMDTSAIALCRDNSMPLHIFNLFEEGNILKILTGKKIGTKISEED